MPQEVHREQKKESKRVTHAGEILHKVVKAEKQSIALFTVLVEASPPTSAKDAARHSNRMSPADCVQSSKRVSVFV